MRTTIERTQLLFLFDLIQVRMEGDDWKGSTPHELTRVAAGEAAGYGCDFQNIDESGRLIPIIFLTRSYRGCQR